MKKIVILHDIRSTHNVGSIFRTADAAGIDEVILTGYTPTPKDRFGRLRKDIAKVALGAEKSLKWRHTHSIFELLENLRQDGFYIIAVEQAKDSVDYRKVKPKTKTAFIFGNEPKGLPKEVLGKCDVIAEIPMHGKKESLNVSVSAGVALFRILGK